MNQPHYPADFLLNELNKSWHMLTLYLYENHIVNFLKIIYFLVLRKKGGGVDYILKISIISFFFFLVPVNFLFFDGLHNIFTNNVVFCFSKSLLNSANVC